MRNEVKEKVEVDKEEGVAIRFQIPKSLHERIMRHRWSLCIEEKREVPFYEACTILLDQAVKAVVID
jgi:hypothetical protein